MLRTFGHIEQGVVLSTYVLQKMPGRNCGYTQRVKVPGMPNARRVSCGRTATQRPTHADLGRYEDQKYDGNATEKASNGWVFGSKTAKNMQTGT